MELSAASFEALLLFSMKMARVTPKAPTVQYRILSIYGYFCICIGIGIVFLHIFDYTVNIRYRVSVYLQLNLGVIYQDFNDPWTAKQPKPMRIYVTPAHIN